MAKVVTTVTIDERVLGAVRAKAVRAGRREDDVIEQAIRRDVGLDVLERAWASAGQAEDEALQLAVEAQHEARPREL